MTGCEINSPRSVQLVPCLADWREQRTLSRAEQRERAVGPAGRPGAGSAPQHQHLPTNKEVPAFNAVYLHLNLNLIRSRDVKTGVQE